MVRQALIVLVVLLLFGVLVPLRRGFDFFDPMMLLAYACLSFLFVAPAAAEAFGAGRRLPPVPMVIRIVTIAAYGWAIAAVILFTGILTVNLADWTGALTLPDTHALLAALTFSLGISLLLASLACLLSLRMSATNIKNLLRGLFLLLLLGVASILRLGPPAWRDWLARQLTSEAMWHWALWGALVSALLAAILALLSLPGRQRATSGDNVLG